MKSNTNPELRRYLREKGVFLWMIAEKMGISEPTISRKLRHELTAKELAEFKTVIDEIAEERG